MPQVNAISKVLTYGVTATLIDKDKVDIDLYLLISDPSRVEEFKVVLTSYLNTRPDAPPWLFSLCDFIMHMPAKEIPGMRPATEWHPKGE